MSHAIVIGSSIAGLTTAHVLSQHFDKITIIDRDQLTEKPDVRKGVPQGYHAHAILRRGLDIMEQHFPGLSEELLAATAQPLNFGKSLKFYIFGQSRKTYNSAIESIACSRPMLESTIYRRILNYPNVEVIPNTEIIGLCLDEKGERATGVMLRSRHPQNGADREYSLDADLIVDASGRSSKAPQWLEDVGFAAPEEVIVNGQAGYASRFYQPPANFKASWEMLMMQPSAPAGKRGAIILPMENGNWQILLLGAGGEYPPTDEEGFMEYIRSLPCSDFYEALKDATPLSPIYGYRRTENQLRHYDKLPRYLEHFLVTGDAVCSFNPMYGQGMSVASMESLKLAECLSEHVKTHAPGDFKGLAATFQKKVADVVAMPWAMASGEDRRWIAGEKPDTFTRFTQWYIEQVLRASIHNPKVTEAFFRVQNLLDAPTALFHPSVMANVFMTRLAHR